MTSYRSPIIDNFEWQQAVTDYQSAPPGSPTKGNRYIVKPTGTGLWAGHDNAVAYYDGSNWQFDTPSAGWVCWVVNLSKYYYFTTVWGAYFTWANIDKSTSNIADITTRSHTSLTDIGSLTHATIDSYLDQAVKQASTPTFAGLTLTDYLEITRSTYPSARIIKSDTETNTFGTPLALMHKTSGDMADAFGVGFTFEIQDVAGVANPIAAWGASRAGADNTGILQFGVYNVGNFVFVARMASDGTYGTLGLYYGATYCDFKYAPYPPASMTYTLPVALPSASGQIMSCTTAGAMSWITLNQAAVAELTTTDSPVFAGLGIGATPHQLLEIQGLNISSLDAQYTGNLAIYTTTAAGAGVGGTLAFGGKYSGATQYSFAVIKGAKEAVDGTANAYLAFFTRSETLGLLERVRITSVGYVGIGKTPTALLDVAGQVRMDVTLTTGAKTQARYFPMNINGTTVNVLTD